MTRRECLTRMFGATVAAALAPLVDLTDLTPAFWNQSLIQELRPWHITFPDGTCFTFAGTVIAERNLADGSTQLTLRPSGPAVIDKRETFDGSETILHAENYACGEVVDIELPSIRESDLEHHDDFGLKCRGNMTLTLNWDK